MWLDELKAKIKEIESVPDEEMYGDDKELIEELGGFGKMVSAAWWENRDFIYYAAKFLPEDEVIADAPRTWKYVGSVHLFAPTRRRQSSRFTRRGKRL